MPGLSSILSIGESGLFASQASIQVTGNNIANVNTVGYSRQRVELQEAIALDASPGQIGMGVDAKEVVRYFDAFVEAQYNDKATVREKYHALMNNLQAVESLFNESGRPGINSELQQFFNDWQSLASDPDNYPLRQVVIEDAQNLVALLKETDANLLQMQEQTNDFIASDVNKINGLAKDIASLNKQISQHMVEGENNPNALYDERDRKVRELAEIIDIKVVDNGGSEFKVFTHAGQTVVDGLVTFEFKVENAKSIPDLTINSTFDGQVYFEGQDDFEYTLEVVSAGQVSNGNAAQFKASLDGGKTWLTDEDGNVELFSARLSDRKVRVGDLDVWFGDPSDQTAAPADPNLSVGDTFTLIPKKGVYWYTAAGNAVNVTPQTYFNGQPNESRLTGGRLSGYFEFRDYDVGRYRDKLDAFTESLVWEVNRIHSQGAGLDTFEMSSGTYSVTLDNTALASNVTGLAFGSRLQSGASSMYFYSAATGELASNQSFGFLDFDSATPGVQTFDPHSHSLSNVAAAVNNTFGTFVTATISNHRLILTANTGYAFAFGTDTTGLYAALGLNTFFEGGDTSHSLGVNNLVFTDSDYLNTGHVNGAGELNPGDNTTALTLSQLQDKDVTVRTLLDGATSQTLGKYYNSLVGVVGVDMQSAEFNYDFESTLAKELNDKQQEVSGVNLDEEMSNLIKFQHSYRAAAKLITTADEMFQTVLGMKN